MKKLKIGELTIPVPIIQGGMGVGVSLSGLASAVANEGGVGVISSAGIGLLYKNLAREYASASILGLKEEIRKAREKTRGILGVNVMVAMSNFSDMIRTAVAEKIDIIFSGAGLPLDLPSFLTKESKTKLVPIVSSSRAARILCEKWQAGYDYLPDAIVVEGPKAGGHLGYKAEQIEDSNFSLETIVPQVVQEVRIFEEKYGKAIPVIAAGGIYTGNDIYRMMQFGVTGVQLGTKFVTTEECDASPAFKQSYIDSKAGDMRIIASPVGMPGRAIDGEFIRRVGRGEMRPRGCPYRCIKTCDYEKSPYCIIMALYNAGRGDLTKGYAFAGANAWRSERITTVHETMRTLTEEYEAEERSSGE